MAERVSNWCLTSILLCFLLTIRWTLGFGATNCQNVEVDWNGGVLVSHSGFPYQPYEDGLDKCWVLKLKENLVGDYKIKLESQQFKLQYSANCQRDFLEIRDGSDAYGTWRGRYCNTYFPPLMRSTGSSFHIWFHTDAFLNDRGFQIRYTAERDEYYNQPHIPEFDPLFLNVNLGRRTVSIDPTACEVLYAEEGHTGYIKSHWGYGRKNYPKNLQSCWLIQVDINERQFTVELVKDGDFSLDSKPNCTGDRLVVFSGENTYSRVVGEFCNTAPGFEAVRVAGGTSMLIVFEADDTEESTGFRLKYSTVDNCGHLKARTTPQNFYSHDIFGYNLYEPNLESCWTIDKNYDEKEGYIVALRANSLNLESAENCRDADYVIVWDGTMSMASALGTFCGNQMFETLRAEGSHMYIQFHTDAHYENTGFNFTYWLEIPGQYHDITRRPDFARTTPPYNETPVLVESDSSSADESVHYNYTSAFTGILIGGMTSLFIMTAIALATGLIVVMVIRSRDNKRYIRLGNMLNHNQGERFGQNCVAGSGVTGNDLNQHQV